MHKKVIAPAALVLALAVLALGWHFRRQSPQPARKPIPATQEAAPPYQFLLQTRGESLALFHLRSQGWQKLTEFPLTLGDLPEADQQLLQTGLVLRDVNELQRSLEDYLPNA